MRRSDVTQNRTEAQAGLVLLVTGAMLPVQFAEEGFLSLF